MKPEMLSDLLRDIVSGRSGENIAALLCLDPEFIFIPPGYHTHVGLISVLQC
jgi:hypothetical protein